MQFIISFQIEVFEPASFTLSVLVVYFWIGVDDVVARRIVAWLGHSALLLFFCILRY